MWSLHPGISPNRVLRETQREGPGELRRTPDPGPELEPVLTSALCATSKALALELGRGGGGTTT